MALVFAPTAFPFVPGDADARTARPVRGATLAGMAEACNHLAGWRLLRRLNHMVLPPVETADQDDTQAAATTWVRWTTGLVATHLWVGIEYLAVDTVTGTDAHIDAVLQTPGGVALDAGVTWVRSVGDLPNTQRNFRHFAAGSSFYGNPQRVSTGTHVRPGAGAAMTRPRPLALPAASGTEVELEVSWEDVRVYSVGIWEMHREIIT